MDWCGLVWIGGLIVLVRYWTNWWIGRVGTVRIGGLIVLVCVASVVIVVICSVYVCCYYLCSVCVYV